MNSRSIRIINQLCSGRIYQISELAGLLDISPRLVRYEIDEANSFLSREGFSRIESNRLGVTLLVSEDEKSKLLQRLSELSVYNYSLTTEERKSIIKILLFSSQGYLTSQYFADTLGVSKSCIDKDLVGMKSELKEEGLELYSKPGSGCHIAGDESKIRAGCLKIVEHYLSFADYLSKEEYNPDFVERQIQKYFCDAWFLPLTEIIRELEQKIGRKLSYNYFRNLLLYLCVSLTRISNNSVISIESQNQIFLRATNEYQIGRLLCDQIAKRFSIEMPASEVCAITVLLVGAKYTTPELYMKEDWVQVQILADRMIRMMSERLNIAFYEDEEIYSALQADLGPMVIRLKNKVPSLNPNLQQIKENYESIFSNLLEVVQTISSPLLAGIQEDDVAYLSLHFCASIERGKRSSTVSRVAIVCVHGVATANLLKEMVCSRFKSVRVVATTTENDLSSIQPADVDFVISSIPLINTKVPWIQVNPLLTPDDFNKIAKMIEKYFSKSETSANYLDFFNDIVRTIENQCEVENMPHLIDSLKKCFDKASIQVKINKIQPSLAQLLPPEKIRCRVTVADWEDAVMQVGAILVNTGDVTPDYIQSIIEIVRNTGPYSVISKGIALVHGKVGSGVNGLSMSMITLKEPVIFHHPINDPVRLILCLAPVDDFSHVSALNDFIEFLRNYDLDRICEEKDPRVINEFLQRSYSLS